ncbi:MAG: 16S rRNA (adenine(1518)-N(6)/adenine(1519)-N(6))-dimethyltransferase RsmA [Pseudomonadota bacterium]
MIFPTIKLIKELAVKPAKKRGQNFLIDKNIAAKTVAYARIASSDIVLEIGPGLGSLTYFFHMQGTAAFSIEIDEQLFEILERSVSPDSSVKLINIDILKLNFNKILGDDTQAVLIGSLPYAITTPILLRFFKESSKFKRAVFIIQKEVAQRLCALPGTREYGIFSVYCQAYMKTFFHATISPECFYPKPKVDSAILELIPVTEKIWSDTTEILFRQLVRASFSKRRKTLYNCLKGFAAQHNIDHDDLRKKSLAKSIDLTRRAETLSAEEFYTLTAVVHECLA